MTTPSKNAPPANRIEAAAQASVGAYEAKTHFSALLEKVAAGEEITITKHGTPVARLIPVNAERTAKERRAAIERIMELNRGLSLGGLKIRDLINEGRR